MKNSLLRAIIQKTHGWGVPVLLILGIAILLPLSLELGLIQPRVEHTPQATSSSEDVVLTPSSSPAHVQTSLPPASEGNSNGLSLLWAETPTGGTTTTLWSAPAPDLTSRKELVSIEHSLGYPLIGNVSPDGKKLVFLLIPPGTREAEARTEGGELWSIHVDGSNLEQIATRVGFLGMWSPDSQSLVFGRRVPLETPNDPHVPFRTELILIGASGEDPQIILSDESAYGVQPLGWSPDNQRFYFAMVDLQGGWSVEAWNRQNQTATEPVPLQNDGQLRSLSLAPSGDKLLVESFQAEQAVLALYDLEGERITEIERLPNGEPYSPFNALWSRDGKTLLVNRRLQPGQATQLESLDLTNQQVTTSLNLEAGDEQTLVPLRWSPDQAWVILRDYTSFDQALYLQSISEPLRLPVPSDNAGSLLTPFGWIMP